MKNDSTVPLNDLKSDIQFFCSARDWDQFHSAKDLAIGLVTEASELLELFRFQTDAQVAALLENPASRSEISDELADALFFILRFSQKYGFDLTKALNAKMKKNGDKYPVERAKGSNLKYNKA